MFMAVVLSAVSKILFSLFIVYFNIVTIFLFNIRIHWGGHSNELIQRIGVAAISPHSETIEYLNNYVDYRDYIVVLCVATIIFILFKFFKSNKNSYNVVKKISFILSVILFLLLKNQGPLNLIKEYMVMSRLSPVITARNKYLSSQEAKLKRKKACNLKKIIYNKIIIIQGESANKNYMTVYGYKKDTTPFFYEYLKSGKVQIFNVIAPANQTRYSLAMFFTEADVHNWKNKFINSSSILWDFKNCGYTTYWVSNQGKVGKYDSYVTNIAEEADNQLFFNKGDYETAKTDIVIKEYLDNKKHNSNKEMYVFHLSGSHFSYNKRYLKKYSLHKNPQNVLQEYENTIFFTDYIVKNIIEYFSAEDQKILVIYLSDHGEVVDEDKHGHGFLPTFKDEYEAPLLIYSSILNKRIDILSDANEEHFFNMENLNYLILYISGIIDSPHISKSSYIFALDPVNIRNYKNLKLYHQLIGNN
jgi:heptose-I-phosphate ethanolaminephosphotransferase